MSFNSSIHEKIISVEDAQKAVNRWKILNQKVGFTNGVFDLMHKGHVQYLMQAADCADKLIIGLNSDVSARTLGKGDNRPIQDESSRGIVLASFVFVSAIVLFDDNTPASLIETLSPDILIKGGDYQINEIAGSEFVLKKGGEVKTIPIIEGYSTTAIENRIKNS